jgi:hypothetical protein
MTEITNLLDVRQTRLHNHLDTDDIPWDRDITTSQGSNVTVTTAKNTCLRR